MKIPDLSPSDLVKNIIGFLIVVATLVMDVNNFDVPNHLEFAFWAVIVAYGFSAVKPTVTETLNKVYGRPQNVQPDK